MSSEREALVCIYWPIAKAMVKVIAKARAVETIVVALTNLCYERFTH